MVEICADCGVTSADDDSVHGGWCGDCFALAAERDREATCWAYGEEEDDVAYMARHEAGVEELVTEHLAALDAVYMNEAKKG